jgi:hypothetical protein
MTRFGNYNHLGLHFYLQKITKSLTKRQILYNASTISVVNVLNLQCLIEPYRVS